MSEAELIYNFFYLLLCFCIVLPPTEFVNLGLTIEQIFSDLLGSEETEFILYHQKRTCLTLCIHASLPGIYFLIHYFEYYEEYVEYERYKSITWNVGQKLSLAAILFIPLVVFYWKQNNWKKHPITRNLRKFINTESGYQQIVNDIGNEFRRQDVLKMKINSTSSLIATENWIIKINPYTLNFAHQSDTMLNVTKSDTYNLAQDTNDSIQIINICIKSERPGVKEFEIRINALDFRLLQDRTARPIIIDSNIRFHQSIADRFVEVFKQQIRLNPVFPTSQITDTCFACMLAEPNIKLQKQCLDVDENGHALPDSERCRNCYCRPMWCDECLARWFASRQNEFEKETWLQKKCTCPLCRTPFCILDVCYVQKI